ncbi:MAG TPA: hypothetical protein DCE41_10180 [Cytophagales bacterium]|nr:hypothetical protein [Cytophagales bacterium]HAA21036.1 hypothetical protein [Cytophagales bacterium]HAP61517.1 hypothetical protein [Cytophagales bacterium]
MHAYVFLPSFSSSMSIEDQFSAAVAKAEAGDFPAAITAFTSILKEDANHGPSYYNRGLAYFRQESFELAIQDYSEAIERLPENANYFSDRGVAYHLNGQSEQAIQDLTRAAIIEPKNAYRYASRAFVKAKAGDTHGAIKDYQQAIALDPQDAIAHNNLGMLQEQLGYQKQAEHHFKKADTLNPRQPSPTTHTTENSEKPNGPISSGPSSMAQEKPKLTGKFYAQTLKDTLTSKDGFREFLNFLFPKKKS